MKLPKITPETLPILIDTREQNQYVLDGCNTRRATLATGDYSVAGLERFVAVERKNLMDFVACCGRERERFQRELDRLRGYPVSAVIVESTWNTIEEGTWKRPGMKITPNHVLGSLTSWIAQGHCIIVAPRPMAERITRSILCHAARHRIEEARGLLKAMEAQEVNA